MSSSEVIEAETSTLEIAEQATPGVTGDLGEVVGDSLETGALAGVMGGGGRRCIARHRPRLFAMRVATIWRIRPRRETS
jgi:hypothetical protein